MKAVHRLAEMKMMNLCFKLHYTLCVWVCPGVSSHHTTHTSHITPQSTLSSPAPAAAANDADGDGGDDKDNDDEAGSAVKVTFPLSELFEPHIACHICYTDGKPLMMTSHRCRQDMLVLQSKQNAAAWFRVRERLNHVDFAGKYHMCNQQPSYAIGKRCPRGDSCTFAHSEVERALWMAEKQGQFDIKQFISHRGTMSKVTVRHTIQSVLEKHPGQLAFLCRDCYLYSRRVSMQSSSDSTLCSVKDHDWSSSAVLAHCSLAAGVITLISRYPSSTDSTLCLMGAFCYHRWKGHCTHPHSMVERELWNVQRDSGLTQRQIVQQVVYSHTQFTECTHNNSMLYNVFNFAMVHNYSGDDML